MTTDDALIDGPGGPWIIEQIGSGELRLLAGDPPEFAGFIDVELLTRDGLRFVGTVGTVDAVVSTMTRWRSTGERLGGRYFWVSDLVLVDDLAPAAIAAMVDDLAATGQLAAAFTLAPPD
jgi:hypothetical protein